MEHLPLGVFRKSYGVIFTLVLVLEIKCAYSYANVFSKINTFIFKPGGFRIEVKLFVFSEENPR